MQPTSIAVPDAVLDDLRRRLDATRLPNEIRDIAWEQGTDRTTLERLLAHWRDRYDWRATERRLNEIPQVEAVVDGQRIHVLHARSDDAGALPLLVSHGWPGSVLELLDVLGPLRSRFHVVAPSLPGFTFSGETSERGWHPRRIAEAFAAVMADLGYRRYGVQGGDWGAVVSANLADLHPERVAGLHLNFVPGVRPVEGATVTAEEQQAYDTLRAWSRTGAGYQAIQGTKPQTLGYALQDSPAGLAAWIVEKFEAWSDAPLEEAFTPDRLLDNIAAYWVTGTAASSLRIYWEMRRAGRDAMPRRRIEVPTAVAEYPGEITRYPRAWVEAAYDVVRWSVPRRGGHFAAMEAPDVFVEDVTSFFATVA